MTKNISLLVLVLLSFGVRAQGWLPVGARSMSLANASVALEDVWAYHHNPGALASLKKTSVGLSYENRFLLKELQSQGLVIAHPLKKGVVSLGAQLYGYSRYRTNRVGLGYSMAFGENLSAGVQINYQDVHISEYGSQGTVTGEFGLLAQLSDQVKLGFSIFNLNRAKLSDFRDDRFASYLRLGLTYKVSSKLLLLAEAEKEIESKIRPKAALEYNVGKKFHLRLGAAGNPVDLTFGIGYAISSNFQMSLGSAWDQTLGWSPHFGIVYQFNKHASDE